MPDAPGTRTTRVEPNIRDFMKLLRKMPERLDLSVRKRFRELAAEIRDEARAEARANRPSGSKIATIGASVRKPRDGRQHWDDLVNSITSGSQSDRPTVSVGSDRVPWALGFEFGSSHRPGTEQFPFWRGNSDGAGYFFYPVVRQRTARLLDEMAKIITDAGAEAFPS